MAVHGFQGYPSAPHKLISLPGETSKESFECFELLGTNVRRIRSLWDSLACVRCLSLWLQFLHSFTPDSV